MTIYRDNYPHNIEAPQKLYIQYSHDINFDYSTGKFPDGTESEWHWESNYIPISHKINGLTVGKHEWMRIRVGLPNFWTYPIRMSADITNINTIVGDIQDDGVSFEFKIVVTFTDGSTKESDPITIKNGKDGKEITSAQIDHDGYLIITYSDGTTENAGQTTGADGEGIPIGGPDGWMLSTSAGIPVWVDPVQLVNDNISAVTPILYDFMTGTISHDNSNGHRHIPVGGTNGQILSTDGAGNYTWADNGEVDVTEINERISNSLSSGLLDGGLLAINTDDTKFDVGAGCGIIIDNTTNGLHPTRTLVQWTDKLANITPYMTTDTLTFVAIDINGALVLQPDAFAPDQYSTLIVLGWIDHNNGINIGQVLTEPYFLPDTANQLQAFWEALGAFNVEGNDYSANGTNLFLNRSEGQTFDNGANYETDKKSANIVTTPSEDHINFQYYYRTSTNVWVNDLALTDTIDPNYYDTGTGLSLVDTGRFTIQLIYFYAPNAWTDVAYGQVQYDTIDLAKTGIGETIITNPYLKWDTLRYILIVQQGANDLSNPSQAFFIDCGKFGSLTGGSGGGGGGGGEINTASNIGTLGEGLYAQKIGVDIQFNNIAPEHNLVNITHDTNHNVLVGLNTSNMTMFAPISEISKWENGDTKFGYLYNFYALDKIAATGWRIPTQTDWATLKTNTGGASSALYLKTSGTTFWESPNTGATNPYGFNAVGGGRRNSDDGLFTVALKSGAWMWSENFDTDEAFVARVTANSSYSDYAYITFKKMGCSVRLIKITTTLTDGQTGTYTGNDGKIYPTICIGTQEWISCNLMETKDNEGNLIDNVTDNTAWTALSTGAYCAYDNNMSNAVYTIKPKNNLHIDANIIDNLPVYADVSHTHSNYINTSLQNNFFLTANSSLLQSSGAYLTTAQPVGAYLTTAMASNAASNFVGLNSALTANGVSATINSSGISLNVPAFLTTAMQSVSSSVFAKTGFTSASTAGTDIVATLNTNGLSVGIPKFITAAAGGGVGLNTAGTNITWTVNTSGISINNPAWITTAMQSNEPHLQAIVYSNATQTSGTLVLSGSNGITIRSANGTAIVEFDGHHMDAVLPSGNGNGTGFSSMTSGTLGLNFMGNVSASQNGNTLSISVPSQTVQPAIGLNTALTANGVSWTVNSSGLSLNVPAFLTTAMQSVSSSVFAKTGVTTASTTGSLLAVTHDTNGLNLGIPVWITTGGAGGGAAIKGSGTYSQNTGTVEFANSNGITFGLSNNGTLTASYNSTQFVAASNTGNIYYNDGNGITWGSSVSSLSTSISASYNSTQFAGTGSTTASITGSVLKLTQNSDGLNLGVPAWITIAAGAGVAVKGSGTYTQNTGTVEFANSNGITFGLSNNGTFTASYNSTQFLTTAMVSNAASNFIGLNSAVTDITATINSSGISISNPGWLTTAAQVSHSHGNPTLALTNLTGTTASASNGFTISLSAAAPGAAAEANWVTLGGNVASNSSASGSTINWIAGNNITLGATNGSQVRIDAGGGGGGVAVAGSAASTVTNGTLQFVNANNVSFGLAGSTMTASIPVGTVAFNDANGITFGSSVDGVSTTISASYNSTHSHGNPTLALTNLTGTTASASNGFTISLSAANPGGGGAPISKYANLPFMGVSQTMNLSSNSWCLFSFLLPKDASISYLRMPISAGMGASTTQATIANTSYSALASQTAFAVLYTQGVGVNSKSLQHVYSNSVGISQSFSYSGDPTNGSYWTWHYALTIPTEHGTSFTNFASTVQTTITNHAISMSMSSALTGAKYLDIPFATSLSEGVYWLGIGRSITSNTNAASATRYLSISQAYSQMVVSQPNIGIGMFGRATNATNNSWIMNAALWTTNVQGTTASINMAQMTTSASNNMPYFQFIREA